MPPGGDPRRAAEFDEHHRAEEARTISGVLFRELVEVARGRGTETYGELGRVIGLSMSNPRHREVIGGLLDEIDRREHAAGRPQLAAVVVRKREGFPGRGFFAVARELGLHGSDDDRAYWRDTVRRVHAFWSEDRSEERLSGARARPPDPQHGGP